VSVSLCQDVMDTWCGNGGNKVKETRLSRSLFGVAIEELASPSPNF
jgi:hypothetical protein